MEESPQWRRSEEELGRTLLLAKRYPEARDQFDVVAIHLPDRWRAAFEDLDGRDVAVEAVVKAPDPAHERRDPDAAGDPDLLLAAALVVEAAERPCDLRAGSDRGSGPKPSPEAARRVPG